MAFLEQSPNKDIFQICIFLPVSSIDAISKMELDFIEAILLIADVKDHFHSNKIVINFRKTLSCLSKLHSWSFGPVDKIRLEIKITHFSSSTGKPVEKQPDFVSKKILNFTK